MCLDTNRTDRLICSRADGDGTPTMQLAKGTSMATQHSLLNTFFVTVLVTGEGINMPITLQIPAVYLSHELYL